MNYCLWLFAVLPLFSGSIFAVPQDDSQLFGLLERFTNLYVNNKIDRAKCSDDPEIDMTTIELVINAGYPAEVHYATSEDGYILQLHRIPGPKGSRAILLHHGFLESSFSWVVNGKDKALAYQLADNGYDVWMGNARGNVYSRRHSKLSSSDSEFWNFSWHEMGKYDVPAEIEYITSLKNDSLFFAGHSMGTTMFFVMANERPDMMSKVKAMFALGPAVYMDHIKGLGLTLAKIAKMLENYVKEPLPFLPYPFAKYPSKCFCNRSPIREICRDFVFAVAGENREQFNTSLLPKIGGHAPAGSSLKTLLHYVQVFRTKKFIKYDYGAKTNMKMYNSSSPPEYDLSKVTVPVAYLYGLNDIITTPEDVLRSWKNIPNKIGLFAIEDPNFTHLDFIIANNAAEVVNSKILFLMKKYDHNN